MSLPERQTAPECLDKAELGSAEEGSWSRSAEGVQPGGSSSLAGGAYAEGVDRRG